ncbi:hypothetical protein [Levilactobacillus andaensis]|uniref:hypothetical protein n=1 Tax=Levilactobacillus andaensis TaxID=2799570 RepID=UPI001942B5B1|nr:hypothetical protein [Levilactobacillus andaensis]
MNNQGIQKYYKLCGNQKIEIVLDKSGIHPKGAQNIAAPVMIGYYLIDYFRTNPSGIGAESMIGVLIRVLAGFNLEVK